MHGYIATLSNGKTYTDAKFGWVELKQHCAKHGLLINHLTFIIGDKEYPQVDYAEVYFYAIKLRYFLGEDIEPKQYHGVGASTTDSPRARVGIVWVDPASGDKEFEVRGVDLTKDSFIG